MQSEIFNVFILILVFKVFCLIFLSIFGVYVIGW